MAPFDHILDRSIVYSAQMVNVRKVALRFAEPKGWAPFSRGRRAHVSVSGPVNELVGVIDIEMEETNWDLMPDYIQPSTAFTLWSSGFVDRDGVRFSCDTYLYWRAPFATLVDAAGRFLPRAWDMLTSMTETNLIRRSDPAKDPDDSPDFGPPRLYTLRPPSSGTE